MSTATATPARRAAAPAPAAPRRPRRARRAYAASAPQLRRAQPATATGGWELARARGRRLRPPLRARRRLRAAPQAPGPRPLPARAPLLQGGAVGGRGGGGGAL